MKFGILLLLVFNVAAGESNSERNQSILRNLLEAGQNRNRRRSRSRSPNLLIPPPPSPRGGEDESSDDEIPELEDPRRPWQNRELPLPDPDTFPALEPSHVHNYSYQLGSCIVNLRKFQRAARRRDREVNVAPFLATDPSRVYIAMAQPSLRLRESIFNNGFRPIHHRMIHNFEAREVDILVSLEFHFSKSSFLNIFTDFIEIFLLASIG